MCEDDVRRVSTRHVGSGYFYRLTKDGQDARCMLKQEGLMMDSRFNPRLEKSAAVCELVCRCECVYVLA